MHHEIEKKYSADIAQLPKVIAFFEHNLGSIFVKKELIDYRYYIVQNADGGKDFERVRFMKLDDTVTVEHAHKFTKNGQRFEEEATISVEKALEKVVNTSGVYLKKTRLETHGQLTLDALTAKLTIDIDILPDFPDIFFLECEILSQDESLTSLYHAFFDAVIAKVDAQLLPESRSMLDISKNIKFADTQLFEFR